MKIKILGFALFVCLLTGLGVAHAAPYKTVIVQGRQLLVDFNQDGKYEPFFIKGVNYEPMPVGRHVSDWGYPQNYPADNNIYNDDGILQRDFTLLEAMGANTIRIWKANDTHLFDGRYPNQMTTKTLDIAGQHNIKVIAGFWMDAAGEKICAAGHTAYNTFVDYTNIGVRNGIIARFQNFVTTFKNRPEILMWAIGNENNYSLNANNPVQVAAYYALANQLANEVRNIEGQSFYHPVAIVDGDIDFIGRQDYGTRDQDLPNIDIWGSNVYRGITFGSFFSDYQQKSTKPLWVAEFGTDAFHANNPTYPDVGVEDQNEQAQWDGQLWDEIAANRQVTIGGTVMEYSDEWWKPYEWNCEDSSSDCRTTINSHQVTFFWDVRPNAMQYQLIVGSCFGCGDVFNGYMANVFQTVNNVPLPTNGMIFAQLRYQIASEQWLTEYAQFPTLPLAESNNAVKIKTYGAKHNYFGFGPQDTSCPLNGSIDFTPTAPDQFWHEEWWGLVSIARDAYAPNTVIPRQAYYTLQQRYATMGPFIALGSPSTILPLGTTSTTMTVATDVNATCKYSTVPNTSFAAMPFTFATTGAKQHSKLLTGLTNNTTYNYYVRCQDGTGHVNTSDYQVSFSISTSYDLWKAQKFNPTQQADVTISGEGADPDHDGIPNLYEYAYNLNPLGGDTNAIASFLLNNHFTIKFRQYKTAGDLTVRIGVKQDLFAAWEYTTLNNPNPTDAFTFVNQDIDANTRLITATDKVNSSTVSMRFFKLEVTRQGGQPMALSLVAHAAPQCGDGVIDIGAGEECDGANVAAATCQSRGFYSGTLTCNASCHIDTTTCKAPPVVTVPGHFQAKLIKTHVQLTWDASLDSKGLPVHYQIYRSLDGKKFSMIATVKTLVYKDDSVHRGKSYYYKIQAYDKAGNKSLETNTLMVTAR